MPHDAKGQEIKKGDRVVFEAIVTDVWQAETACNLSMKAVGGPDDEYHPSITCNSKLVTKVEPPPADVPPPS